MLNVTNPPLITAATLFQDITRLRQHNPLVHNITNLVTMPIIANVLLAAGASPLMAHATDELAEITSLAQVLVINIGTMDNYWATAIRAAQQLALKQGIPVIFDPVGAGASRYRTAFAKQILTSGVTILRGNASEIMALTDSSSITKGVDSQLHAIDALQAARQISRAYHCTVVVSGSHDLIINTAQEISIQHGTPLFSKVIGMGCAVTALIGAFAAINKHYFMAASHAIALFTVAGEIASQQAQGPGSFYNKLLDILYLLKAEDIPVLTTTAMLD